MDEVTILRRLLEAYSPSGEEGAAVREFAQLSKTLGLSTRVDEVGNAFARKGSGRPQVLFLGHIDTVPGELPVAVKDGRITGRGACDAKGALAAALIAASRHAGPGEILIAAAVGEEKDSRGARHLIPRHAPDLLIVGEPSGWDAVTIGYKGNVALTARFEGERSHLSSPAATTVETALAFVHRLKEFCWEHRGETPFTSLTAKVHSITTRRDGGRETVEAAINLRLPERVRVADIVQFLEENDLAGKYRIADSSEAVVVEKDNPVVRALRLGIRRAGGAPTLLRKAGTADMNLAVPVWGCPAAAYGPGDAHLDHTDMESVAVKEFQAAIRILEDAFRSLTAEGRPAATAPPLSRPAPLRSPRTAAQ